MRTPAPTDFHVEVDTVGVFRFARRTMRDEMRIQTEYSRLTEGVATPTEYLALVADWMATLSVLIVSAPDGWDMEQMDPLDEDTYAKLMRVYNALRAKEGSFRRKPAQGNPGGGAGPGQVADVLVPAQVQPPAA